MLFWFGLLEQDKLLDMELLADFLLFHLNQQGAGCQAAYCQRYGIEEPIDDIVSVLVSATCQRQLHFC